MISASTGSSRIGIPNMDGGSRSEFEPLKGSPHRQVSSSNMNEMSIREEYFGADRRVHPATPVPTIATTGPEPCGQECLASTEMNTAGSPIAAAIIPPAA